MKFVFIVSLLLLITSCGKGSKKDPRGVLSTESSFFDFQEAFVDDYNKYHNLSISITHIPINFGDTGKYVGLCTTYSGGYKEITIEKKWWDSHSYNDRKSLIYHELGHCFLGRDHKEGNSLMSSHIIGGSRFSAQKGDYLKELFHSISF